MRCDHPISRTNGVSRLAAIAAGVLLAGFTQAPQRFGERVDVARVMIDARVLDATGDPILGLAANDFEVRIDGKPARVETVTWIGDATGAAGETPPKAAAAATPLDLHRLTVFLFQKDLEPSRIVGLMRMLLKSRNFLEGMNPDDRVAILSFDSRLRIWTDFTSDRERIDRILGHDLLLGRPPAATASAPPSLVERLDRTRADTTYGIEDALELIGRALEPLPGSKSLVFVGHGFGRLGPSGVAMEADYDRARRALAASRTSVFSLDVTDADYHSLEAGLQLVSADTGGFYVRTHLFPDQAMHRLAGALAGYYVLFVERPESRRASHDLDVSLTHGNGRVLASSRYAEAGR